MAIYSEWKTLVWPLNTIKKRVTSAFGLIGGQTSAGPGNEGINAAVWIQERIDDGTIIAGSPTIQEEGNPLPASDTINFVGAGVTVTDAAGVTTVTIPGGGASYTDEQAQDAVGAMVDTTLVYTDGTPAFGRAALTGDVTANAQSNVTAIAIDVVDNTKLSNMAANTVKVRNNGSSGDPVDMVLPTDTLLGRNAGVIQPITLGTNLSMTSGVLNATGGSGAGISEVEVGTTLIRYIILTGTPVFTANIASGVQTITATGGTYKLVSVATTGATANLAGDNSFTIIYNGVPGTTLIAYPSIDKWNLSGSAPSSGVPDIHSLAASPQHQLIGAVPGTSVTIRLINMNTYTNWCIKSIW